MKKTALCSLFAILMLVGLTGAANAQVSVQNVLNRASAVIDKLESQKAQVVYMKVDTLEKGQLSTQEYTLDAGSSYAIVTIGDQERIQDIDLVVADADSKIVGKDDDEENLAIVKLSPKKTGSFTIGVKGFKMNRNDGFYAIIICRLD